MTSTRLRFDVSQKRIRARVLVPRLQEQRLRRTRRQRDEADLQLQSQFWDTMSNWRSVDKKTRLDWRYGRLTTVRWEGRKTRYMVHKHFKKLGVGDETLSRWVNDNQWIFYYNDSTSPKDLNDKLQWHLHREPDTDIDLLQEWQHHKREPSWNWHYIYHITST